MNDYEKEKKHSTWNPINVKIQEKQNGTTVTLLVPSRNIFYIRERSSNSSKMKHISKNVDRPSVVTVAGIRKTAIVKWRKARTAKSNNGNFITSPCHSARF